MRHPLYRDDTMSGLDLYFGRLPSTKDGYALTLPANAVVQSYRALSEPEQEQVFFQSLSPGSGGEALFNSGVLRVAGVAIVAGVVAGALAGRYLFPKRR